MKRMMRVLMCLLTMMMLTGCMKIEAIMTVDANGEATLSMKEMVSKSLLNVANQSSEDYFKEQKEEYAKSEGVKVTDLTETYDGQEYVGIKIEGVKNTDENVVKKEGRTITVTLDAKTLTSTTGTTEDAMGDYTPDQLKESGVECNFIVNMPYAPTSNVGKVEDKKVTLDLLTLSDELKKANTEAVVITCEVPQDNTPIIMIGIAAVIVIAVGVFMVMKKRKNKTETV